VGRCGLDASTTTTTTTTTSPLHSHWNIGPQQLSSSKAVAEVSVTFKFFIETGLLALCSNPQPGGPGLHIYIPWRLGGPVIPPGTKYPFSRILRHAWATVGLFFSRSPHGDGFIWQDTNPLVALVNMITLVEFD
jgi:hypothetical protein